MILYGRMRIAAPLIAKITLIGVLAGAAYGGWTTAAAGGAGLYGIARGALVGGVVAVILASMNVFVLEAPIGEAIRRAPFLVHLAVKSLVYLGVFLLALAAAQWFVPIPSAHGVRIDLDDVVFFFAVSFVISFLFEVNSLLGQNVLLSFAAGRYFRPRVEQRVFLMIDMKNSTAAAERLGEVAFHRLLNRFISDLTDPIVLQKGEIHKYVGDELIVTWPLAAGLKDARCLRACFGAIHRLAELGTSYECEFGLRVDFRAGLHCGPVVVGEMGTFKKEIAMIGDTLNTTARVVDACRDADVSVIASSALLEKTTLPPSIVARSLGPVALRGKKSPIELFALEAVP
jgi:adenylate cyclase